MRVSQWVKHVSSKSLVFPGYGNYHNITNLICVYETDKQVILMYVDIYVNVYLDWCMCLLLLNAVYNQKEVVIRHTCN